MLTTLANYRLVSNNIERSLTSTAAQPQVARETEYYLANIGNVKSIDDFLADDRLFTYAMQAWGLGDMSYAKAFMRKVLTEGVDSNDAFANTLADSRYKEFAKAFNFKLYGEATTNWQSARQGTVDRYVRQKVEEDAGSQNEGVRLALYFERKASSITSAYSILADQALLKVAQTALGLPATMSLLDIDRQAELIADRIDLEDFQDTTKVQAFLTHFAATWEIENSTATQLAPSLLLVQPIEASVSSELLSNLQNLKLGGA
ncbi:MAG: DUF1217 domain-containing protein [Hyphomicrobium sp.]|uniref:DUF1217 domain-containing protein n=1 Tax=Hyphomicrobium sp. TaxID=82 RepID=UPI0013258F37|nr:DUF1217 domain-containing protein [Hyphomicrobium sp.]KAB2943252.1 MAG: DUF1217 domain-containing protein [Hyphomicrobium sp.]MBZ0210390.1 DUF1217 domain-containing protein [Hyphomicrobium sp.]MCZ7594049.1 DUF1217 domain-containing protein [Hyphomicrobium sp.]